MHLLDEIFAVRVRTMQIISAALIAGVVTLTGIMIIMVKQNDGPLAPPNADLPPLVSIIAVVSLAAGIGVRVILPNAILRGAMQRIAGPSATPPSRDQCAGYEGSLLAVRQTTLIMANALLEGPALFCAIAYMLEGQAFTLAGVAVALVLMLWQFPTREGVRAWLERHLDLVLELRQLGGTFDVE
jgi:hypothetical protein